MAVCALLLLQLSLLSLLSLVLSAPSLAQPLRFHAGAAAGGRAVSPVSPSPSPSLSLSPSPSPSPPPGSVLSRPSGLLPGVGVCLSGMEYGSVPGTPGVDYAWPTADEWQYFASKRFTLVRLPFKWERVWPQLGGELDPFSVGVLRGQLSIAASLNMSVLLDCHNYARYGGSVLNGTSGPLTSQLFADFWLKMAKAFQGTPGLHGYDLMNEPSNMPDLHVWPHAAQAAILAIRTVDMDTTIYLEGNNWSSASTWVEMNPDFPVSDPASRVVYSCHCYLDRDNSGTHFDWDEEAAHGVTVHTGEERLQPFVNWTRQHNVRAHLGEMGIGSDSDQWSTALDLSLAVVQREGWEMTYWVAGAYYHYIHPMGIDRVTVDGRWQEQRQMAPLAKYAQSSLSATYFLRGPAEGAAGRPSANFTLDVRAYIPEPVTLRCYDGVHDSSFWRTTTTFPFNLLTNLTFTAQTPGQYQIYCTNDGGWTDAPALQYTATEPKEDSGRED